MADSSPWRPQARHPNIPHLRQREIDVQFELDATKDICERRVSRAVCPSPDEQAAALVTKLAARGTTGSKTTRALWLTQ